VRAAGRGRLPRPIGRRRREPPRRQKPMHALAPLMCLPPQASAPWLFESAGGCAAVSSLGQRLHSRTGAASGT
jgi:hypothetical protein